MGLLSLLLLTLPFWIPVLIGCALLVKGSTDELARMAGWLTLKPILATPMWVFILASFESSTSSLPGSAVLAFLSILPGASLTALTVLAFSSSFSGPSAR